MTSDTPSPWVGVVDDEPQQRRLLGQALEEAGYQVVEGADGEQALELARAYPLDVLLLDVRMPRLDGLAALKVLTGEFPQLPVILLTAFIDVRDAVEAIKTGARDYLEKPIDLDELVILLDETVGLDRGDRLPGSCPEVPIPEGVIAESPALRTVFQEAARAAASDVTVLIYGESGSGKEVLARYLHSQSPRFKGPLVAVNCAALPETLIESALFGHEKGPSLVPIPVAPVTSKKPTAGRCSSTRSATCPWRFSPAYYVSWKTAVSVEWEGLRKSKSISAFWLRPTAHLRRRSRREDSAKTSTTASTSSPFACLPCASVARISCRWRMPC